MVLLQRRAAALFCLPLSSSCPLVMLTDSQTPNRWYFYEIYASEEAYQLHRQTPHFRDYLRQTAHMSASKDAIPVKPVFLRNKGGIKQDPHR